MFTLAALLALAAPAMAQFALTVSANNCTDETDERKKPKKKSQKIFFSRFFFPFFFPFVRLCAAPCVSCTVPVATVLLRVRWRAATHKRRANGEREKKSEKKMMMTEKKKDFFFFSLFLVFLSFRSLATVVARVVRCGTQCGRVVSHPSLMPHTMRAQREREREKNGFFFS
jgi:hypothetical protein